MSSWPLNSSSLLILFMMIHRVNSDWDSTLMPDFLRL